MRTKIFKLIVLVVIAQISLYACCDDDFNVFITSFDVTPNDATDQDASSVTNPDFSLIVRPVYDIQMASLLSKQSGFINMANATSCDETYTVVKSVTNIELRADVPLFGIDAGAALNERVVVEDVFNDAEVLPLSDMISALNYGNRVSDAYSLKFDTEIPAETTAIFTFIITFENGDQLERTATAVTFE